MVAGLRRSLGALLISVGTIRPSVLIACGSNALCKGMEVWSPRGCRSTMGMPEMIDKLCRLKAMILPTGNLKTITIASIDSSEDCTVQNQIKHDSFAFVAE